MVGWTIRSSTAPAPAAVHGLAATKDASDPFSRALLPEVDVGISSVFIEGEETCLQAEDDCVCACACVQQEARVDPLKVRVRL